jgi:PPOX class probable FMN-dependent enzyme
MRCSPPPASTMTEAPPTMSDPNPSPAPFTVSNLATLEALFGPVGEASIRKEVPSLHPVYRRWLEAAPFAVLATSGPGGLDASPRGDPAPLVTVQDEHTLLLPERRGNNRIDSLRNIVADPRVALLFMIPDVGETLRVNGRAHISVDPDLLQRLAMDGHPPKCVIVVHIETVLFQCARALQRSKLWAEPAPDARSAVPSAGAMLAALTDDAIDGAAYDRALPDRQRSTLY